MQLTIFTPTYNRLNEILGLYESICMANEKVDNDDKIEWLIVDDGSSVDISTIINRFISENRFPIIYIKKENGGKHTAFNYAIDYTQADIFVCIDDDDRLTPNSLEDIFTTAKQMRKKYGFCIGGIVGRVVNEDYQLLGKNIKKLPLVSNTLEIRDKYKFWGEPEVFYVPVLKKYRFDVFEGEKFLTEAYVFDQMSKDYPFVYTNEPYMVKKYLADGLTSNQLKIRIDNPRGTEQYYYQRKRLCKGVWPKLRATINRRRFEYWININDRKKRNIDLFEIVAVPLSYVMYLRDKHNYDIGKNK